MTQGHTNLVVLPSRGRPEKAHTALSLLREHSCISDICLAIDDDQSDLYERQDDIIYEVNPRRRMNGTLNLVATKYAKDYQSIFFLGDDHLVRTPAWDVKLFAPIKKRGYGLSYGDDLFQGQALATSLMMSTNIIEILGFMAPPALIHLYMDNFWMHIGQSLQCLDFVPDVIIEHMHYAINKSAVDSQYLEVNSAEMYAEDRKSFELYCKNHLWDDMHKIWSKLVIK